MKKILVLAGTRPEAIKMAPVVQALRKLRRVEVQVCATGQHREMLQQAFADFGITPDSNLDVMTGNQTLATLSARLFAALEKLLAAQHPDVVLVQGDTTTAQVAALCAFYQRIPVGHVEAGLRSHDLSAPFPEELNRRIATLTARWHFVPTELSRRNLLLEGIPDEHIVVTGNTVIDALLWTAERVRKDPPALPEPLEQALAAKRPIILITGHRRENFGSGLEAICRALKKLSEAFPEILLVYPVHPNPHVREVVNTRLGNLPGILLLSPLPYAPFVRLMDNCRIILTDSGGIQEEGPSLGKPVLIMREVTERPEGIEAGVNALVGTDAACIVEKVSLLLSNRDAYEAMAKQANPYGDGRAAERIAACLGQALTA